MVRDIDKTWQTPLRKETSVNQECRETAEAELFKGTARERRIVWLRK
jgi:hypothetical protein